MIWRLLVRYLAFHKFGAVVVENVMVILFVLVDALRMPGVPATPQDYANWLWRAFLIALIFQIFLHLRDVYDFRSAPSAPEFLTRLGQAVVLACLTIGIVSYMVPAAVRGITLPFVLIRVSVFLIVWHILVGLYFGIRRRQSNVLIMGTGRLARALATEILSRPQLGMAVSGFVDDNPALLGVSIVNPKVIGLNKDLRQIVSEKRIEKIVVELQDRRGRLPLEELLELKTHGVEVEEATTLYERVTGKIAVENLKPSWMIFNEGFEISGAVLLQKQITTFAVSTLLLIVFFPLFPIIALLIKLDSRGPVFHHQDRVGRDGTVFTVWKFRSMHENAEQDTGPVWATPQDGRVTRVGKYLRRARLDELPQLYNILKGDMSLVGPRPERPHFVNQLSAVIPYYCIRHSVKPGVTGWAQIHYRYGNTVEDAVEKLQYDLFYIKNMSWLLDLIIMLDTAKTVLVRKGS